ncbi:MAG: hypothetical protein AVDCRST_MAG12-864 [uncultured Rubrobacteraceae bacterium]|uniref:Uncharacterized protein n=1 Tax=uncultured Rubrobacteraceae bacterium TaxID=349277 RepID=A0A6J4REY6_9ACTN|nr:MAG: hypothetical protein AVDCRST_MAG12-864 [uncultured Rubrobacteraceae bacterium]
MPSTELRGSRFEVLGIEVLDPGKRRFVAQGRSTPPEPTLRDARL